jgi:hypothetical protein
MDSFTTFINSFISSKQTETKFPLKFVDGNSGTAHPVPSLSEGDLDSFETLIDSFISPDQIETKFPLGFVDGNSGMAEGDFENPVDSDGGGSGTLCVIA